MYDLTKVTIETFKDKLNEIALVSFYSKNVFSSEWKCDMG